MTLSIDRRSHRAAIAGVVFVLLLISSPIARIPAVFLIVGVLPGVAVVSRSRFSADAVLGVGTALSPVIFGALVLAAMLVGVGVHHAAWFASMVGLVAFVVMGRPSPPLARDDTRTLVGGCVVLLVAAVLALSLPIADTWWRVREDSWFHAAVANKLARDGLPLTDPYFAGLRIQYMYAYHALVAACASLAGVDYFRAMILLNAIALTSSVFAFLALAGEFSRRPGPRVLATCLWIFGLNGWFYLSYPIRLARAMVGQTHGLDTLRHLFPWTPAGHTTAMSLLSVEGNQFMFLDKFMIGTALSLTLGLAATLLLLLIRARRGDWSTSHDAAFVLCIAGPMLLHMVTGLTMALVTAAVLATLLVMRSPSSGGPSYARLVGWIVLALAATAPYVYSVMPRHGGAASIAFALQRSQAIGLLFGVLPALLLAIAFVRRASRDTAETLGSRAFADASLSATGIVLAWTLLVAVVGLVVDLATNNETKFVFPLFLPLAALATGALDRWWEIPRARRAATALVISATIPLHVVYFSQVLRDPTPFEISDSERAVYAWLEKETPRDAVVVDGDDNVRVPVLASRDVYWGTEGYARNWDYPRDEMLERKRVRDAVYSERGPTDVDLLRLTVLERPVFVIYRHHPEDMIDAPERFENDLRFRGRFTTPEIAVWEIDRSE